VESDLYMYPRDYENCIEASGGLRPLTWASS
jgi:hypothetical protein